jgi:hypothetical protein
MKRILTIVSAFAIALGGAAVATGAPGPNDSNNHGLCTALFNGSQQGQENKQQAGPFATLISEAVDGPSDEDDQGGSLTDAWDWCQAFGIGGQPDDPTTPENDGNGQNGKGNG